MAEQAAEELKADQSKNEAEENSGVDANTDKN